MDEKPKTIICDIDGCISWHSGDICSMHHGSLNLLPGTQEILKDWDRRGYNIILMTGRRESVRKETERQLSEAGIFYDQLIMGVKNFPRVVINDRKEGSTDNTAFAINLKRNQGLTNVELIGPVKTPWGVWEILLDDEKCKVKKITINPGQAPSYQYHFKRNEYWTIIEGRGTVNIDDSFREVNVGDTVFIKKESKHQMRNTGVEPLVFIETQTGEYFGEDDIVRLKDDYGRAIL